MFVSKERPPGYKWWLFKRIARRKTILFSVVLMTIAVVFATMYLPVLIGEIIDEAIIAPSKRPEEKKEALASFILVLLGLVAARVILGYLVTTANDYLGWATEKDLRE
ncbi:MAG: hypothetical protein ACFFB3_18750, partial [Candidatus Hodarchaeota archaeon]